MHARGKNTGEESRNVVSTLGSAIHRWWDGRQATLSPLLRTYLGNEWSGAQLSSILKTL